MMQPCPWALFNSDHLFRPDKCRLCKGKDIVTKKQATDAINRLFRRINKRGRR